MSTMEQTAPQRPPHEEREVGVMITLLCRACGGSGKFAGVEAVSACSHCKGSGRLQSSLSPRAAARLLLPYLRGELKAT